MNDIDPTTCMLVLSNLPDRPAADILAAALVQRQAAACVNVLAPCKSVYRWKGAIEETEEIPVLIKTTADRYGQVEKIIRELHPYELPEIVAFNLSEGLPAYLQWVYAETRSE